MHFLANFSINLRLAKRKNIFNNNNIFNSKIVYFSSTIYTFDNLIINSKKLFKK